MNNILNKVKLNTVVCIFFIIFASSYFYIAMGLKYWSGAYAPGPGFIPRWSSGAMVVFSVYALIKSFKGGGPVLSEVLPKDRTGRINLFVCWGALLFIVFFVEKLGFVLTASISLTAMFSRGSSWLKAALIGVSITLIGFFVFRVLLQMSIPVNQFGF